MKVAVIGAGASGLVSMKSCLDEGLEPVCFEQEDYIGGLWYFTPDERHSSVYRSTVANTSSRMTCFSDFPIPKEFPQFMHHSHFMKYFHLFAKHFDLYKYIRFRTKILEVKKAEDFEETGNWELYYTALEGRDAKLVKKEVYNAVMVCVGHLSEPHWPSFPGLDVHRGVKMHSHAYKDYTGFEGKTVLIIGIGNSGGDIAVELSLHCSKTYLSTRRGSWLIQRTPSPDGGVPIDQRFQRRVLQSLQPGFLRSYFLRRVLNAKVIAVPGLVTPSMSNQSQIVNSDLQNRIMNGDVIMKPNVARFTETGVEFEDGTADDEVDVVIFCTGYDIRFNCIDRTILPVDENQVTLYKYVFPPHLSKPTMAVLGCIQSTDSLNPLADLQARWVTRVFKGIERLPSRAEMMADIKNKKTAMAMRYYASRRHTVHVDYIAYSDELADLIGCKPSLWKLLFTDPVLAFHCYFGPCVPPQYRLTGPGAWPGARDAIMNADGNIHYSTKSRVLESKSRSVLGMKGVLKIIVLVVILVALFWKIIV